MIRGVFFDAGNTIVFPDYGIYRAVMSSLGLEASLDDVVTAEAGARSAFDDAVASEPGRNVQGFWPVYYTPFYQALGVRDEEVPVAIERTRAANAVGLGIWQIPVDGLGETMDALRERDLAVGIVSNSDGRLDGRLTDIGIRDHFDFVIDSGVVGVSKPDPAIFGKALEASSLSPSEAAYVGDYYAVDVVGARGAGMKPVLFDPVGAYEKVDCDVMKRFADIIGLVDAWAGGE
jgi:putative hydrolase of the HAD superfamily